MSTECKLIFHCFDAVGWPTGRASGLYTSNLEKIYWAFKCDGSVQIVPNVYMFWWIISYHWTSHIISLVAVQQCAY